MNLTNMPGAQRVDAVLNDDQRLTLMEEYEKGRIRPAGALAFLKSQGVNTGGLDRMDVSDWLRAAVTPAEGTGDDGTDPSLSDEDAEALKTLTDDELGALAALDEEERSTLLELQEAEGNDDHDEAGHDGVSESDSASPAED